MPRLSFPVTFVVGSGRSGSSALSRALRLHPGLLSLNELLASLTEPERALPASPLTGEEFWRMLAEPSPVFERLLRDGVVMPEFLDPRPGLPALSLMVLPHLTDDPPAVLAALEREVPRWPRRPAEEHFAALLALLREHFGREAVVERSGYSVMWIPRLRECFPEARFVHMHRYGPDCALSMSRHTGYQTIMVMREVFELTGVATVSELTEEHLRGLPPELAALVSTRIDTGWLASRGVPVARFGELWSELVTQAVAYLAPVPAGQRTELSYERLLDDPRGELARLARFAGVAADERWLDAAAPLFTDASRGSAARELAREELAALREACAPGTQALAAAAAAV